MADNMVLFVCCTNCEKYPLECQEFQDWAHTTEGLGLTRPLTQHVVVNECIHCGRYDTVAREVPGKRRVNGLPLGTACEGKNFVPRPRKSAEQLKKMEQDGTYYDKYDAED